MVFGSSADNKLRQIAELIDAGQKKEARQLLREVLSANRKNLEAWELLWRVVYSVKEELICLNHILAINPEHLSARRRMDDIRVRGEAASTTGDLVNTAPFISDSPFSPRASRPARTPPPKRRKKKGLSNALLFLVLLLFPTICIGIFGFAAYRAGYMPALFGSNLTATALAQQSASCRAVIEKAMEVSGSYCDSIDSNKACYGNNTIQADLAPEASSPFSERGDIVDVNQVRRISASPLKMDSEEWGIAVLKITANLPRSLPGETVTMVVFGNTTLDNESGTLESFFFSSELGQIVCEKVPNDGIMINVPDGSGVTLNVNGSELTLTGDASITAAKNGKMEISLYEGTGRIVSDGQEQYFGAGQKVEVQLGGENGNQSVGPPSAPESLSEEDLNSACAMTGQFCTQDRITPVPPDEAQQQLQEELGITPTITGTGQPTPTRTGTASRTPTITPSSTFYVLASWTPSPTKTPTRTNTPVPTRTRVPTQTPTTSGGGGTPSPTVSGVIPNSGPTAGGTSVTISGTNFVTGATVRFGGTVASGVTVVNSTTITATTPAHASGAVNIVVTNPGGQSGTLTNGFLYLSAPTVSGVAPTSGLATGGTSVTISGTNFVTGATVSFGGTSATLVTVVNSTTITATTPAHASGAVNVVVTNPDTQSGTLINGFTYLGPGPTVSGVTPNSGPTLGDTPIMISGTNFVVGASVSLGGTNVTNVTVVNSTTITGMTKSSAAGTVDVVVTNPDTQSGTLSNGFTYVDPWSEPLCTGAQVSLPGPLIDNGTFLTLDLTNNAPGTITIDAVTIDWNVATATRILEEYLGSAVPGNQFGNANQTTSPADFPSPNPFTGAIGIRQIDSSVTKTLYINFQSNPTGAGYTVQVHFDIGCRISASK